jgi:hypothetical protein
MTLPYADDGHRRYLKDAIKHLKFIRRCKAPLDTFLEPVSGVPVRVRHVAEEALRSYGEPLTTVQDRTACVTHAIKLLCRMSQP